MMIPKQTHKYWLPFAIAAIGILLSFLAWYLLSHNLQAYLDLRFAIKTYLPVLVLILGIAISLLIAAVVRVTQLAYFRTVTLKQVNIDLKKEISERIAAEESKQKLEVALLQGQKLQAIGTLAGGIAHDFNNLLYAIIGYIEMSREDVAKDSIIYQNLGKVLAATHRGQDLISRILAFSRRQHHQFDVIELNHTIETILALLTPTIPASVILEFSSSDQVNILGNQTQIHQVLVNIINNAVDAMDGEGTIRINLSAVKPNDPLLKQVPEIYGQNYCKIEISDTGHGMDQTTLERIYEPFFTTKEVGKGTGLGLSIVHSIIKEHQGEITVRSQLGKGTTFTILLPKSVELVKGESHGQNITGRR